MPVPPQIAVEVDAALSQLRDSGFPEVRLDGSPTPIGGGFWAEIWSLPLAAGTRWDLPARLVLRLPPDANLTAWETAFQAGVADQDYPTPRIRAYNFQPTTDERSWSVMDYSEGSPMLAGLGGPRALIALPRLATGLPDTLARASADLHRLDPEPVRKSLARATSRTPGVDGLLDHYLALARELANTGLVHVVEVLASTKPQSTRLVLCHGDLHPFNVLTISSATAGSNYAVLDWTNGQITHPEFDLAFTHLLVSNPPLVVPRPLRPVINAAGRRLGSRFLKTYGSLSQHSIDHDRLEWFKTLHACRISLDLASWRADDSVDAHPGHPWLTLEPALAPLLAK